MSTRDALSTQKAKALAPALPETAQLRELFAAVEVALANHKGPAIECLRAAYEAMEAAA